ncbi:cytochrome b/b6 domain-containing protein [Lichenifustis flavocetrariae]|uniref:Cytochrome b/b6 domain-containing protein n=1 Tax=Lichenifustis flavocetrariae TaxID=2949735 RepID=A0AA41Z1S8_9HYPH|nr:cytochrome b/b6 domain-containing protein [Lichenifustis flavocetrariae]MCW6512651.1 cytochrome b/b6 domain-containing protein [Lichenifustis flavocetrariae]
MTRIWDPIVRLFHWSLVLSFSVAWFTPRSSEALHHWAGYAAAALILMRLLWGVVGTRYARFSQFVRDPATVARYLSDIVSGKEARYLGHNPAGGVMVMVLIAAMASTALTGWMMMTDAYFGVEWVESAHELAAHGLLVLVLLHLGGVVLASVRHRENLVGAMVSGRKHAAAFGDVDD